MKRINDGLMGCDSVDHEEWSFECPFCGKMMVICYCAGYVRGCFQWKGELCKDFRKFKDAVPVSEDKYQLLKEYVASYGLYGKL